MGACCLTVSGPPKPRLTLRVGIAGHRQDKLDEAATERIEKWLPAIFVEIDAAATQILAANGDCYTSDTPVIRLVSGFAQGTDHIAVRLRPASWHVDAVLPFARDVYADTFANNDVADVRGAFADVLKAANTVMSEDLAAWQDLYGRKRLTLPA
jgi:hypothetical protein